MTDQPTPERLAELAKDWLTRYEMGEPITVAMDYEIIAHVPQLLGALTAPDLDRIEQQAEEPELEWGVPIEELLQHWIGRFPGVGDFLLKRAAEAIIALRENTIDLLAKGEQQEREIERLKERYLDLMRLVNERPTKRELQAELADAEREIEWLREPVCQLAGPGRGDCEHFVGLPGYSIPGQHDGVDDTVDVYGRPNGWCWHCWHMKQKEDLQAELTALRERTNQTCFFACGCRYDQAGVDAEPHLTYCPTHSGAELAAARECIGAIDDLATGKRRPHEIPALVDEDGSVPYDLGQMAAKLTRAALAAGKEETSGK